MAAKKKAKKKIYEEDVILSTQSFKEARGDLEKPRLNLRGIVRGLRSYHSTADADESYVREEAEEGLQEVAARKGYTHVYGCKIVKVGDWDNNYGKCWETFYLMEGNGYSPSEIR